MISMLTNWTTEVDGAIFNSELHYMAVLNTQGEVLFANKVMQSFFDKDGVDTFTQPTFKDLIRKNSKQVLIYEGILSICGFDNLNTSFNAKVYKKENELLILGSIDFNELDNVNNRLVELTSELSNMQRQLYSEKEELKRLDTELQLKNKELKELLLTRDKFYAIISHDLRSPFLAILGFAEMIENKAKANDFSNIAYLSTVLHKAAKLSFNLLDNLLHWSRLQRNKIKVNKQEVDLQALFQEVLELYQANVLEKEIRLSNLVEKGSFIDSDKNILKAIIRNLLSNATKFTNKGDNIEIGAKKSISELIIWVKDNGVGMTENEVKKLYNVNTHFTKFGTENEMGYGIGLIVTHGFVQKLNGRIWVESKKQEGSTFFVALPF